jgi:ligand-binding sensor domain-containing protein
MKTVSLVLTVSLFGAITTPSPAMAQYPGQINYNSAGYINSITSDDEKIWAACQGMLVCMDKATGQKSFFTKASTGLAIDRLTTIFLDNNGALWMGFSNRPSTARYVNGTFEVFDSPSFSSVGSFLQRNATICAGTDCGVARFTGSGWEAVVSKNNGLPHDTVACLAEDPSGRLWIACSYYKTPGCMSCQPNGILACYNGSELTLYDSTVFMPLASAISYLSIDTGANIWFSTKRGDVGSFNGQEWQSHTEQNSPIKQSPDSLSMLAFPVSLACAPDGNVWFGLRGDTLTLVRFDGSNWFSIIPDDPPILDEYARCLLPGTDSTLWFSTYQELFSLRGTTATAHSLDGVTISTYPSCIAETRDMGIWIGTAGGIAVYRESQWSKIDSSNSSLPPSPVRFLYTDGGDTTWAIVDSGIYFTNDGEQWTRFPFEIRFSPLKEIFCLFKDSRGSIWIGSSDGLTQVTANDTTLFFRDLAQKDLADVECIYEDKQGAIWAGCMQSIGRFDGTSWKIYRYDDNTFPRFGSSVKHILEDVDGTILAGAKFGSELAAYDKTADMFREYAPACLQTVGASGINCTMRDHAGRLWFGINYKGIIRCNGAASELLTVNNSALMHDDIVFLMEDRSNKVWAGTRNGIVVFDNTQIGVLSPSPTKGAEPAHLLTAAYSRCAAGATISFVTALRRSIAFTILTLEGAEVWSTAIPDLPPGRHSIFWPGRCTSGKAAPAGCYIVKGIFQDVHRACVITLVR